jgi:hypothetical protein
VGFGGATDGVDWDRVGQRNPSGRVGTPEDIAGLATFLCSRADALLDTMAAAAVQTFASNACAPRQSGQPELVRIWKLDTLIDTCHSYRSDGPVIERMKSR